MKAIFIDKKEPPHIQNLKFNCLTAVSNLDTGDMHILANDDKLLIVERKTAQDFCNSIKDGRLFNQVARAKQITHYVYVVIVGAILPGRNNKTIINGNTTGWDYAAIQGVMLSIQELGASIVFCADDSDFAACIVRLANRSRDAVPVTPVREANIFGGAETILASLPGIGVKKAVDLLAHFPNAGSALWFLTDVDDKQTKIPGIGENTKQNIVKALGGKLSFEPTGDSNGN